MANAMSVKVEKVGNALEGLVELVEQWEATEVLSFRLLRAPAL